MSTVLLIFMVSLCTVLSQLILKKGAMGLAGRAHGLSSGLSILSAALQSPLVWASLCLQGVGFSLWILVLSREKLGVAFGLSGAFFYLLLAFLGWAVFDERLSPYQWMGIVLITLGVLLTIPRP